MSYRELPPLDRAHRALAELARTGGRLAEVFENLSHWERLWKPEDKVWNCVQVAAHLLDVELVFGYRIRTALAEPGQTLEPFDQDRWVDAQRWVERPVDDVLAAFSALRKTTWTLLSELSDEEWLRSYVHRERGPQTIADTVALLEGHDARHLVQLGRTAEQARHARAVA
jgi:uncharacterized damage-inducible protein DinB